MKRTIAVIILFVAVVMLPPLIHGYIYPTIGDDAAVHISLIQSIKNGAPIHNGYYGQLIVGYPLSLFPNTVTSYLWFSYVVLAFFGLTCYYVVMKRTNKFAGVLAMFVPVFAIGGVLFQWYQGQLFNIINISIMLWAIHLSITWMDEKKWTTFLVSVALFVLAFLFHPSGYYIAVIIPSLAIAYFISPRDDVRFLVTLAGTMLGVGFSSLISLSSEPFRQILDAGTFFGIGCVVLLGILVNRAKVRQLLKVIAAVAVIALSVSPVYHWLADYNSAIKPVDKVTINYVNALSGEYFQCSPEINPQIYGLFLNKTYEYGASLTIVRNIPMTQKTMPDSKWYWWQGARPDYDTSGAYSVVWNDVKVSVIQ